MNTATTTSAAADTLFAVSSPSLPPSPAPDPIIAVADNSSAPVVKQLFPSQEKAYKEILKFLVDPDQNEMILMGGAGNGKTSLIRYIIDNAHKVFKLREMTNGSTDSNVDMQMKITSTTHKACGVLRRMGIGGAATIHSAMGMSLGYANSKSVNKSLFQTRDPDLTNTFLIIDEAGMCGHDVINTVVKAIKPDTKVLWVFDPCQLPPTKLNYTPIAHRGLPTIELTDVIRQNPDDDIMNFLTSMRESVQTGVLKPFAEDPNGNVEHLKRGDFFRRIESHFQNLPANEEIKVLAWTNKDVQKYNQYLSKKINGHAEFRPGDFVINNSAVSDGKGILLLTDEQVQIVDIGKVLTIYDVVGQEVIINSSRVASQTFFMPLNQSDVKKKRSELIKDGSKQAIEAVRSMDTWVDLRYEYACTVHKSQGSTYHTTYIDLKSFANCYDTKFLARLLYTAASRSSNRVVFTSG